MTMRFSAKTTMVAAIVACALMLSGSALATGMGFYGQMGFGSNEWEVDGYGAGGGDVSLDGNEAVFGLGYLFDTNCARQELINYRILAGYEYSDLDLDGVSSSEATHMLYVDNILGFSPYSTGKLRFWVGPEVRVFYRWGDGSNITKDIDGIGLGIGPVAGINLHMGKTYDFGISTGIRWSVYNADWKTPGGGNNDITATDTTVYVNFAFIFRSLDDQFGAR
jgi:hypothetical protein